MTLNEGTKCCSEDLKYDFIREMWRCTVKVWSFVSMKLVQ